MQKTQGSKQKDAQQPTRVCKFSATDGGVESPIPIDLTTVEEVYEFPLEKVLRLRDEGRKNAITDMNAAIGSFSMATKILEQTKEKAKMKSDWMMEAIALNKLANVHFDIARMTGKEDLMTKAYVEANAALELNSKHHRRIGIERNLRLLDKIDRFS